MQNLLSYLDPIRDPYHVPRFVWPEFRKLVVSDPDFVSEALQDFSAALTPINSVDPWYLAELLISIRGSIGICDFMDFSGYSLGYNLRKGHSPQDYHKACTIIRDREEGFRLISGVEGIINVIEVMQL